MKARWGINKVRSGVENAPDILCGQCDKSIIVDGFTYKYAPEGYDCPHCGHWFLVINDDPTVPNSFFGAEVGGPNENPPETEEKELVRKVQFYGEKEPQTREEKNAAAEEDIVDTSVAFAPRGMSELALLDWLYERFAGSRDRIVKALVTEREEPDLPF